MYQTNERTKERAKERTNKPAKQNRTENKAAIVIAMATTSNVPEQCENEKKLQHIYYLIRNPTEQFQMTHKALCWPKFSYRAVRKIRKCKESCE